MATPPDGRRDPLLDDVRSLRQQARGASRGRPLIDARLRDTRDELVSLADRLGQSAAATDFRFERHGLEATTAVRRP